jgi:hypothetical protein
MDWPGDRDANRTAVAALLHALRHDGDAFARLMSDTDPDQYPSVIMALMGIALPALRGDMGGGEEAAAYLEHLLERLAVT